MNSLERPGATAERPARRSRLADLGDRLARTFGTPPRANGGWESNGHHTEPMYGADTEAWDPLPLRFPVVRHGYDCVSVDEYVLELERELEQMRASAADTTAINQELERVGEQTSAILRLAYEQAHAITQRARVDADDCIQQAAARAETMTEEAKENLRVLDGETDAVWRERARLIEDVRTTATALFALAEDAAERFPADPSVMAPQRAVEPPAAIDEAGPEVPGSHLG